MILKQSWASGSVSQMTLYPRRIPCIAGVSHVSQFNLVSYDAVAFVFQLQKPGRVARPDKSSKKIHFFMDQSWDRVGFCMTLQKPLNFPGFLGSGLCDPSDTAGEPFCIQEFCIPKAHLLFLYGFQHIHDLFLYSLYV